MNITENIIQAITSEFAYEAIYSGETEPKLGSYNILTIHFQGTKEQPHCINDDDYDDINYIIGEILFESLGQNYTFAINHMEHIEEDGLIHDCKSEFLFINIIINFEHNI